MYPITRCLLSGPAGLPASRTQRSSTSANRSPSTSDCWTTTSPAVRRGPRRSAARACCRRPTSRRLSPDSKPYAPRSRRRPDLIDRADDEDVHSFVERELVQRIGDAGRRLHTGRSRNEQVSLDIRLYLRRRIPELQRTLADVVAAAVTQAENASQAVMPSYTHLRRAQPVLVAHMWLAHAAAFRRDVDAIRSRPDECDAMPLGSGAIAGHQLRRRHGVAGAAAWASAACPPTAWTSPAIAISPRRSSTPARWRWCTCRGWRKTSSSSRPRSSASSSWPMRSRPGRA